MGDRLFHNPKEKQFPRGTEGIRPLIVRGREHDWRMLGGKNLCAQHSNDYEAERGHTFHPTAIGNTWRGNGYRPERVDDPDGPFDGWWYASDYRVELARETWINPNLLPNGPTPLPTIARNVYQQNIVDGLPIGRYLQAIRDHERQHSTLMQQALSNQDPAPRVEAMIGRDDAQLQQRVDKEIKAVEVAICNAAKDPLPQTFLDSITLPYDDTGAYEKKFLLPVGGPGYGQVRCQ